jgi:hypothetical protein
MVTSIDMCYKMHGNVSSREYYIPLSAPPQCVLSVCISITHAYSKCTGNYKAALDTLQRGDYCIMGKNTDYYDD